MGRYSRSRSRSRDRSRDRVEDEGYRVHVADLGVDCSQRELEKSFEKFGDMKEVWLARNPPCFAFVVYKHKADGEEAIKEMDGRVVCGSRVRVNWARPRARGRNKIDPGLRCYQCGERGHFSRDCRNGGGRSRGYRSSRYDDDDYDRRRDRRRSRSRSGRRHRRSSHSRSKSRSKSRDRRDSRDRRNGDSKKRTRSKSRSRSREDRKRRDYSRSRSRSQKREERSRSRKRSRSVSKPREDKVQTTNGKSPSNGSHNGDRASRRKSRSKSRQDRSRSRHSESPRDAKSDKHHGSDDENHNEKGDKYDPTNEDRVSVNGHDDDHVVTGDYQSHNEDD